MVSAPSEPIAARSAPPSLPLCAEPPQLATTTVKEIAVIAKRV
jgi:hypothetical protein